MNIHTCNPTIRRRIFLTLLTVWLFAPVAGAQPTNFASSLSELRAQLDAHINQPRFNGALWGVKIASLTTGKTLYEHHPRRLMSPASNSKLFVGALALDALGGDYQLATPLFATAPVDQNGLVAGDLIVSGRGDPSWKAANFRDNFTPFIAALTNAGVRRISGDLVADTTFFNGPPYGSSWTVADLTDSEGAEISALTLNDNLAQLAITPGTTIGSACQLVWRQPHTGLTLVNRTQTSATNSKSTLEMWRAPGTKNLFIFGEVPLGGTVAVLEVPVPEPAAWFGAALQAALAQQGIVIAGKVRCLAWPEMTFADRTNWLKLGQVKSPPLRELVRAFMKPSQNLETDLVFAYTGESLRATNAPAWQTSEQSAVAALKKFLAAPGGPVDLQFDEGSGLSRNNLTSAHTTLTLLTMMATNRWAKDFHDSLPIAGVDGTIRRRMKGTPAEQNVHAKTGTLRWVNALSGHVTTATGEKLVFSLMLNRYDSPPDRKRTDELDAIAVWLAGFTGRSDE